MPGSRITQMGGTGELSDQLTASNYDGISDYPTSCAGGPLAVMQRGLISPANTAIINPSPTTAMPSAMTAPSSTSSGME